MEQVVVSSSKPGGANRSQASVARRALQQPQTQVGIVLTAAVLLVALIGPFVAPHSPTELVGTAYGSPSRGFLLGTDYLGRDVLSRVLWGGRSVVWMALASATVGVFLGVCIGMLAGYSSAWCDETLMRGMDVILAFPQIVLVLLFVSIIGSSTWLIVLVVGLTWTPQVARITRGLTLDVVHREYVESAEVLGVPRRRILLHDVLPNLMTPITVEFGLRLTWSIAVIAAVSFLGFGISPPNADWGLMINENRDGLTIQPWPVLVPAALIASFAIGTNFVAEGFSRTIARVGGGTS